MTKIDIDIEVSGIGISGSPAEVGLIHTDPNGKVFEDNTPNSAEALLEFIKQECDNDKDTFLRDWDLIDNPTITICVNVDGVRTYVDW